MTRYILLLCLCVWIAKASAQGQDRDQGVTFHTDFEGGNLGEVIQIRDGHWRLALTGEADWDNRNRQVSWYYCRVEGAKDRKMTLVLTDLVGEYNYKSGTHAITSETRPMISYDQQHWIHVADEKVTWNEEEVELTFQVKPQSDTFWIAHQPPYTGEDLQNLMRRYADHPSFDKIVLGETAEGRPMPLISIADPHVDMADKKVVWIMARQHSWEAGTSWVMEGLIRHLLESAEGHKLLKKIHFQLFPLGDPDGVARGGVRFNTHGHDLNRNWDLVKELEMPEIYLQKEAIRDWVDQGWSIDLFITLHNTERADYIQGPDLDVGKKLWEEMVQHTSFESTEGVRKMPISTTLGKPGRMTVNQALWSEMGVPAYLMELKVERVGKMEGRRTTKDWLELGRDLIMAAGKAVK